MTGNYLFSIFIFFSFWFCLVQGVRRSAGSIADEKRDGTLGLLFLTHLRPLDIILGKLCSAAIPLVQPLLAFLPVLAISVLLGGTTGGEIFRSALVLASVLLYSISVGMLVSSFSRTSEQTGMGTLILLVLATVIPRFIDIPTPWFRLSTKLFTPLTSYLTISDPAYRVSGSVFHGSLLITNLLSASFLAAAAFFLPRRWEAHESIAAAKVERPRKARETAAKRATILDRNPGEWLAVRHSIGTFEKLFFTAFILVLALAAPLAVIASKEIPAGIAVLSVAALIVIIRLGSQASFPLCEARRSGAIEMINTTPLNPKCLVTGQFVALRNQFIPLLGVLLISSLFCVSYQRDILATVGSLGILAVYWGMVLLIAATTGAFGMWMGLREKSPNAAFFKTMIFIFLLPLFLFCFWFAIPVYYIILFLVSLTQLTGQDLQRLVRGEKRVVELTPVPSPVAPPIIKQ